MPGLVKRRAEAACSPALGLSRQILGLRASPRLLVIICCVQAVVLLAGTLMQIGRADCAATLPDSGPMVIDCDSCRRLGLTFRGGAMFLFGLGVISTGLIAVWKRDQRLIFVYGSTMVFFAFVVGLTAVLTALESPVLEVAVEGVAEDAECLEMAYSMMFGVRGHAALAVIGCMVDTAGAVLAIRSKELFTYEEISAQHAAASRIPGL